MVNSRLQDLAVPNVCSSGSVVVKHRFLPFFYTAKKIPPKQDVTKLFFDTFEISSSDENHINALHNIVILPSELILSALYAQINVLKKYNVIATKETFKGSSLDETTKDNNLSMVSLLHSFRTKTSEA